MNALNIQTGWWVVANYRFVAVYNTKEEAINHIKFQKEQMGSTAKWYYQYIKMSFGEHGTLDQASINRLQAQCVGQDLLLLRQY